MVVSFGTALNGYQHAQHAVGETLVKVEADWVVQRARRGIRNAHQQLLQRSKPRRLDASEGLAP